jgi:hypothetical protein
MFRDGQKLLAAAIVFAVVVLAWMFRYAEVEGGVYHQNRLTGAICHRALSCWFISQVP